MGFVQGLINGVGAVAGGLVGMALGGFPGFVAGAMVGTMVTDALELAEGERVQTGFVAGTLKGLAAAAGGAAGVVLTGFAGFVAGPLVGAVVGDLLWGAERRVERYETTYRHRR